jgi:hypothetical protein
MIEVRTRQVLTVVGLAVLGLLFGLRADAPAAAEGDGPDPLVVVGLPALDGRSARELAALLPDWEEKINAGTTRLTLPRSTAESLTERGVDVEILGTAFQSEDGLPPWKACYPTLAEVHDWLRAYGEQHADLVEVIDIGDSLCKSLGGCTTPGGDLIPGADLLVARLTNETSTAEKRGVMWIDGGIHSREIATVKLMQETVRHFVEGYGVDPQITWLLDHHELHVGIASNPDGRQHVELGSLEPYADEAWLWRKNGNQGEAPGDCAWPPSGGNQYGVDLNRNQAFKWDEEGHSTNPCAATYRGTEPASEPEIVAYEDYLRTIFADQRGPEDTDAAPEDTTGLMINFHSATYPGTVLVPWGWTTERAPNDADLLAIGQRYATQNGYNVQYALYPVSGNTRDWGYGELGIPAYVIELQSGGFISPCDELPFIVDQNLDAIEAAMSITDQPYRRIRGPEITRLIGPERVTAGGTARLRARATELRSGRGQIAAVEAIVARAGGADGADWLAGPAAALGEGIQAVATDGAFDERSENVRVELDTAGLEPGRYLVAVRGADAEGHWGAPVVTWLNVEAGVAVELVPAAAPPVQRRAIPPRGAQGVAP